MRLLVPPCAARACVRHHLCIARARHAHRQTARARTNVPCVRPRGADRMKTTDGSVNFEAPVRGLDRLNFCAIFCIMQTLGFLGDLRHAFVAHLADRLSAQICTETAAMFAERGIEAPVRSASVLLFLLKVGPATLAEMARHDGQSHQLLATRLAPVEAMGLVKRSIDPDDGRRRPYVLTKRGAAEARRVEAVCAEIASAMDDLFSEMDVNLLEMLDGAMEALRRVPIDARTRTHRQVRTRRANE